MTHYPLSGSFIRIIHQEAGPQHMGKLWQRRRDHHGKSVLEEADLSQLHISKPSVIFLTGIFTTNKKPAFIAGGIKSLEELLAGRPGAKDPVDIYAWSHSSKKDIFNFAAYNLRPATRAASYAHDIARGVILPLVAKDISADSKGKLTGQPLPIEEAKKNLRNVTLFAYSAGAVVAQEAFNAAMKDMQKIGYTDHQARDILHEVVLISTGSMSRPTKEKDRFTTIYLAAHNDLPVKVKNQMSSALAYKFWKPLTSLFTRLSSGLRIKALSAHSVFITAAAKRKQVERQPGGRAAKIKKLSFPGWLPVNSYHELPRYITQDETFSPFAKIVQYTMTNAINRQESTTPAALLKPPAGIDDTARARYQKRIEKATASEKPAAARKEKTAAAAKKKPGPKPG